MTQYTPKYNLPVEETGDEADMPEYSADLAAKVEAALDGKPGKADLDKKANAPGVRSISYGTLGSARSTLKAVSAGQYINTSGVGQGLHDFTLVWTPGFTVNVAVDQIHQGAIQWVAYSRKDLKTDLKPLSDTRTVGGDEPDVVGFLKAVDVWEYTYLDIPEVGAVFANTEHLGFIADDVDPLLDKHNIPRDLVSRDKDGRVTGFNDRDLVAVLWQVVKEQQARIEALEAK